MFTLGDVADILDSALDTGISIVDALAKLSDIADEGGLVDAKGYKFSEEEEAKQYDENGNLISRNSPGSDETSDENISTIVLSDDSGVCSGGSVNFSNSRTTTATSSLLLDSADSSNKLLSCNTVQIDADGHSTTGILNSKVEESDNFNSNNNDGQNVVNNSTSCEAIPSTRPNSRSTYVLELSNAKNSGNKLFEKNPVFEAFGNLCHIADDVLKYRKDDSTSDGTESNPDALNAKVNDMLFSFQKLDETVEKLKLQAMQNHLANHPEDEAILTTHRLTGNRKESPDVLPYSDPGTPVMSRRHSDRPHTTTNANNIDSFHTVSTSDNCKGYSVKHSKDSKQINSYDAKPSFSRQAGIHKGSKGLLPDSNPDRSIMQKKHRPDNSPETANNVDHLFSNGKYNCRGYTVKHLKDSKKCNNVTPSNSLRDSHTCIDSKATMPYSAPSTPVMLRGGSRNNNRPHTYLLSNEDSRSVINTFNDLDLSNGNYPGTQPSLVRQESQETYILDNETDINDIFLSDKEETQDSDTNQSHREIYRETYTLLNSNDNLKRTNAPQNGCSRKISPTSLKSTGTHNGNPLLASNISKCTVSGNSSHIVNKGKGEYNDKKDVLLRNNGNTFERNSNPRQTYILNEPPQMITKTALDNKKPQLLPKNSAAKKSPLQPNNAQQMKTGLETQDCKKRMSPPKKCEVKRHPLPAHNGHGTEALHRQQLTTASQNGKVKKSPLQTHLDKQMKTSMETYEIKKVTPVSLRVKGQVSNHNINRQTYILTAPPQQSNLQNNLPLTCENNEDPEKTDIPIDRNEISQKDLSDDTPTELNKTKNGNISVNGCATFTRSQARSTYVLGTPDNSPNLQRNRTLTKEIHTVMNNNSEHVDEKTEVSKDDDKLCRNSNYINQKEKKACANDTNIAKATDECVPGKGLLLDVDNECDHRGTYVLVDQNKKKVSKNKHSPIKKVNAEFLKNANNDGNHGEVVFFITTKQKSPDTPGQVSNGTTEVGEEIESNTYKSNESNLLLTNEKDTPELVELAPPNRKKDVIQSDCDDATEYELIYEVNNNGAGMPNVDNMKCKNAAEKSGINSRGNEQGNDELCYELLYEIPASIKKNEGKNMASAMKQIIDSSTDFVSEYSFSFNNNETKTSPSSHKELPGVQDAKSESSIVSESSSRSTSEPISISKQSRAGSLGSLIDNNSSNFSSQQLFLRSCSDPSSSKIKNIYSPKQDLFRKLGTLQSLMSSSLTKLDTLNHWHEKRALSKDSTLGSSSNSSVFGPQEHIEKSANKYFSLDQGLASFDDLSTSCKIIEKDTMVVLIDENSEEVEDDLVKSSSPNLSFGDDPHFNISTDTERIGNVSSEDDVPCTYTVDLQGSSTEDITPFEEEWHTNISINNLFNEPLNNNKEDFLAMYDISKSLPLSDMYFFNNVIESSLLGGSASSGSTSPVSRADTFVLTPTSEEEKDLLLGLNISESTFSCPNTSNGIDFELEQSTSVISQRTVSNEGETCLPLEESKTGSLAAFIHPNSISYTIPATNPQSKTKKDKENVFAKTKDDQLCFCNTKPTNKNLGKESGVTIDKTMQKKENNTKTHSSSHNSKRGQKIPVHTNFLRRRNSNVKLDDENEEETLTIQLAALRSELEEKRKKFNKEKKKQQQQWKERAQNFHNGFFITLKNEEQKHGGNESDFTSCPPNAAFQDNAASQSESYDVTEDIVKEEKKKKVVAQLAGIELQSKKVFENLITTTPEEDTATITLKRNKSIQRAETSRTEIRLKTSILKLEDLDIDNSFTSGIPDHFNEPNDHVLIPVAFSTPESTPLKHQNVVIEKDDVSTPSTDGSTSSLDRQSPSSDSTYILTETERIQIDFPDLTETGQEPITCSYMEERHEGDNTIDETLEQVSSSLLDLLNYVESLSMNEIPGVEDSIVYSDNLQMSENVLFGVISDGDIDTQLVTSQSILGSDIVGNEPQRNIVSDTTPKANSHLDGENATTSFAVGFQNNLVECPELTPQQKRKRERFLRQRQKNIAEEKEKKAQEVENVPETPAIPSSVISRKVKRDVLPSRTPRTQQHTTNSTSHSPDEASRYPDTNKRTSGKSNRKIIQNAMTHCCLCGGVNKDARTKCFDAMEKSEANHFLVLFREGLKFRSVYEYHPETETVTRVYGVGPKTINEKMINKYFKFDRGGKGFSPLETKHLSIQVDGFSIKKELWEKKQANTSKPESNLKKFLGNTQRQGYS